MLHPHRDFSHPIPLLSMRTSIFTIGTLAFALLLAACGSDDTTTPAQDIETSTDASTDARTVTLSPVGETMAYDQTEIHATAGETLRVVLVNTATSPIMEHNFVLLTSSEFIQEVGEAALTPEAVENAYIPKHDAIIAHTVMAKPGETVEVTFTVPSEPGEYPYICTFPAHFMTMRGVLIVS